MTFTYAGTLANDLDKVRFYIQDTVENSGPKPSDGNFTDEELSGLVSAEGTWQRAVAAGYEVLAAVWARFADLTVGPRKEAFSQIAERYAALAKEWRAKHGAAMRARVAGIIRVDGYSDDVPSDETDASDDYTMNFEYVRPEV